MITQVPSRHQGFALITLSFLLIFLLVSPALAKKDMQIASEGDPGDGNLSPESSSSAAGSNSYNSLTMLDSWLVDPASLNQAFMIINWLPSIPGMPTFLPTSTLKLFSGRQADQASPLILQREGRWHHAH